MKIPYVRIAASLGLSIGSILAPGCQPDDARAGALAGATRSQADSSNQQDHESIAGVDRLHERARAERSLSRFLELLSTSPKLQRVKFMTEEEAHDLPWEAVRTPIAAYADAARSAERRLAHLKRTRDSAPGDGEEALDEARQAVIQAEALRGQALRLTMEHAFRVSRDHELLTAETGEEHHSGDRDADDGPHPTDAQLQPRRPGSNRARLINEMIEMYPQAKLDRAMVAFLDEVFVYRLGPRPGGGDQALSELFHDYISTANAGPQITIAASLTGGGFSDIEGAMRWLRIHVPELAEQRPRLLRGLLEQVGGVTDEEALREVETGLPGDEAAPDR